MSRPATARTADPLDDRDGLRPPMTAHGDGWLDPRAAYKPLDCGNGRVAVSVAPDGAVLALAGFHPLHGHAGFIAQQPFADADRGTRRRSGPTGPAWRRAAPPASGSPPRGHGMSSASAASTAWIPPRTSRMVRCEPP